MSLVLKEQQLSLAVSFSYTVHTIQHGVHWWLAGFTTHQYMGSIGTTTFKTPAVTTFSQNDDESAVIVVMPQRNRGGKLRDAWTTALPNTSCKSEHRQESNPGPQYYKPSVLTARPLWWLSLAVNELNVNSNNHSYSV
ncbi:hypothetical protein L798_12418 [Zootermopsis nevadensis]|uniref:Uncharacterized protein n=1 Tax=Zootermopsis nevadensis TaxID=136037 RepID=A0A067RKQ6_ZOONE|nr:hypothetical protein L798_12418 [Zootermopsis nevadensis]